MKTTSQELLDELKQKTKTVIAEVEKLSQLSQEQLSFRPSQDSWNILECLEHLNRYADFYLPAIEKSIAQSKHSADHFYSSRLLGNYFANVMPPRKKLNKMNTFQDKNPIRQGITSEVIQRFLSDQYVILDQLEKARAVSLTKNRTATSISKWVRLMLGDTLRVVIYHNERHVVQIQGLIELQR